MPNARPIKEIIIHCSATPNGRWQTVEDINAWHSKKGFRRNPAQIGDNQPALKNIGYHYVIYTSGPVVIGRGEIEIGAHCLNRNAYSLGVCMIGTDQFSRDQWVSLAGLVIGLRARLPSIATVLGHRDTSPDTNHNGRIEPSEFIKLCPGFSVAQWLAGNMRPLNNHLLEAAK